MNRRGFLAALAAVAAVFKFGKRKPEWRGVNERFDWHGNTDLTQWSYTSNSANSVLMVHGEDGQWHIVDEAS